MPELIASFFHPCVRVLKGSGLSKKSGRVCSGFTDGGTSGCQPDRPQHRPQRHGITHLVHNAHHHQTNFL